jgi:superoxide dismutase, Fe-Mn family
MSFSLPELPYAQDALAPYMSRETLEYHHDKHHLAYVNNGNNLAKGTEWENKPVEEVVKGTFGKNQGLFNNAGQHYNHIVTHIAFVQPFGEVGRDVGRAIV